MKLSLHEAGKMIASAHSLVLSTHMLPDGDGLGAEIALYHYLNRLGKSVRIINPDQMPGRYRFLDPSNLVEVHGHHRGLIQDIDLVIVVDTGDYRRLKDLWPTLKKASHKILFLDHHPRLPEEHPERDAQEKTGKCEFFDVIDERSSSIGELLYRLFNSAHDELDPHNPSFKLSPEIALGLYVSVLTDTNSFRYSRTTALSHFIAADLIDYGLQPEEIYQNIYSTKSIDHLRLIGEVLSEVQETSDGQFAWVEITREIRHLYKASADDTQTIVNFMLLLKTPQVLILLREEDDGRIKGSLKSKGKLPVNMVAAEFGGGGHEFAAGFVVKGSMAEIRSSLLEKLSKISQQ